MDKMDVYLANRLKNAVSGVAPPQETRERLLKAAHQYSLMPRGIIPFSLDRLFMKEPRYEPNALQDHNFKLFNWANIYTFQTGVVRLRLIM